MAYQGTTSTAPNVPRLVSQSISGANKVWMYKSTHLQADLSSTGFFRDGAYLGMSLGDTVLHQGSTTFILTQHTINVLTSTGAGCSAGLIISSAS